MRESDVDCVKICMEFTVDRQKTWWTTKKDMIGECRSGYGRT